MAKLPYMQFYPADYLLDTAPLSPAARGIWMDLICLLWRAEPRGVLSHSMQMWACLVRCSVPEFEAALDEFRASSTCEVKRTSAGAVRIASRRMLREERARSDNAKRQQRFRGNGDGDPLRWAAIRVRILERDQYMCGYCGRKARTVDYILPKSKGGTEDELNLVACCRACNAVKNNKTLEECGFTISSHNAAVTPMSQRHNAAVTPAVTPPSQRHNRDISESESESESEEEKKEKKNTVGEVRDLARPAKSAACWARYREAYLQRWCVEPVRNQRANTDLCRLVDRLGVEMAPQVAGFYLSHQRVLYVTARHPTNLLLRDAEALRTDFLNGHQGEPDREAPRTMVGWIG